MWGNAPVDQLGPIGAGRPAGSDLRIKREFVTVVYGPVVTHVFPDLQTEAYRHLVLYVNLVSVVDCSDLKWVDHRKLRRLASEDRLLEG